MEDKVDVVLSSSWNKLFGDRDPAKPEHFWIACRILSDAGLAEGNKEHIALTEIGPFKMAAVPELEGFLQSFSTQVLPAILKLFCSNLSLREAAQDLLVGLFGIIRSIGKSAVRITEPVDWAVLLYIKRENKKQLMPTCEQVEDELTRDGLFSREEIRHSIKDLSAFKSVIGNEDVFLIIPHFNGKLECRA
jgi:hypothetical protein